MQTTKLLSIGVLTLLLTTPVWAASPCPPDSVLVGTVCVDKYEASVWQMPIVRGPGNPNAGLIKKIQKGRATLAALQASGATLIDCFHNPSGFNIISGNWTGVPNLFAVSVAGTLPTDCLSWFAASQACALAGKRLLTNSEWQTAAVGTPDGAPCNVGNEAKALTGAAAGCVSSWGAFDMVGNFEEWVADWVPRSADCGSWGLLSDDEQCLAGADTGIGKPGALIRGGRWGEGSAAGTFAVSGGAEVTTAGGDLGFRCAR